jgi:hypothetical protein
MASIWKELMFLQGHFVRVEDVLDAVAEQAAGSAAQRADKPAPRVGANIGDGELACGGCA